MRKFGVLVAFMAVSVRAQLVGTLLIGALVISATASASAFDRSWALGGYLVGGSGDYGSAGLGGRLRWEVLPGSFGIEVFAQQATVSWPGPDRMDHVGGFALYLPLRVSERVRVRPMAGFCGMLSLVDRGGPGTQRDDDVMTSAHAGVGLEVALTDRLVLFADSEAWAYLGNGAGKDGWTRQGNLGVTTTATVTAGLSVQL